MNNGADAADQMVRECLQFAEIAIKLSALGVEKSLSIAWAHVKENPKVRGKTNLDRLLREGKELKLISLQAKDLKIFEQYAKQYGVLFLANSTQSGTEGEALGRQVDSMRSIRRILSSRPKDQELKFLVFLFYTKNS